MHILDEAGMIDPAKLKPITFDPANRTYWSLGEKVGNVFSDGSKLKSQRRRPFPAETAASHLETRSSYS